MMDNTSIAALPIGYEFSRYRIVDSIGQGGFAFTYKIQDKEGGIYVLKELFPATAVDRNIQLQVVLKKNDAEIKNYWDSAINGFMGEAKLLSNVKNNSIPKLIDTFKANNTYYIVQEFIEGETLDKLIPEFHSLPLVDRQRYLKSLLIGLLKTLNKVHSYDVLHRDIKPNNIIIRNSTEEPVLIDFGGVRFQIGGITDGPRVGATGFSSLEQCTSNIEQTESSDLYSLAATFYVLLFNKTPKDSIGRVESDDVQKFIELKSEYNHNILNSLDKAFNLYRENRFKNTSEWLSFIGEKNSETIDSLDTDEEFTFNTNYKDNEYEIIVGRDLDYANIVPNTNNDAMSRQHLDINCIYKTGISFDDSPILKLYDLSSNGTHVIDANGNKWSLQNIKKGINANTKDTFDFSEIRHIDLSGTKLEPSVISHYLSFRYNENSNNTNEKSILATFIGVFKKAFDFKGRSKRKEYWTFSLIVNFISVIVFILGLQSVFTGIQTYYTLIAITIITIIPGIAVTIRRLHDTNRSGWYLLLAIIPIANFWFIYFMFQKSIETDNFYN